MQPPRRTGVHQWCGFVNKPLSTLTCNEALKAPAARLDGLEERSPRQIGTPPRPGCALTGTVSQPRLYNPPDLLAQHQPLLFRKERRTASARRATDAQSAEPTPSQSRWGRGGAICSRVLADGRVNADADRFSNARRKRRQPTQKTAVQSDLRLLIYQLVGKNGMNGVSGAPVSLEVMRGSEQKDDTTQQSNDCYRRAGDKQTL